MRPAESFSRANVTEVGLEFPETQSNLLFDVRRHMTKQDWDWIARWRQELPEAHFLTELLSDVAIIDRSRLNVSDEEWEIMENFLSSEVNFFDTAVKLNRISPGRARISPVALHTAIQQSLTKDQSTFAVNLLTLSNAMELDPSATQSFKLDWPKEMEFLNWSRKNKQGDSLALYLASIARIDASRLEVTDEDWHIMHQALQKLRENDPSDDPLDFADQAAYMAVIARTIQSKKKLDEIPTIPETKSYSS